MGLWDGRVNRDELWESCFPYYNNMHPKRCYNPELGNHPTSELFFSRLFLMTIDCIQCASPDVVFLTGRNRLSTLKSFWLQRSHSTLASGKRFSRPDYPGFNPPNYKLFGKNSIWIIQACCFRQPPPTPYRRSAFNRSVYFGDAKCPSVRIVTARKIHRYHSGLEVFRGEASKLIRNAYLPSTCVRLSINTIKAADTPLPPRGGWQRNAIWQYMERNLNY